MLAALASAAMPSIVMAGVRDSERANDTDDAAGIDQAVMQDAAGRMYDIYACDTEDGRKRLTGRVQAARTLGAPGSGRSRIRPGYGACIR